MNNHNFLGSNSIHFSPSEDEALRPRNENSQAGPSHDHTDTKGKGKSTDAQLARHRADSGSLENYDRLPSTPNVDRVARTQGSPQRRAPGLYGYRRYSVSDSNPPQIRSSGYPQAQAEEPNKQRMRSLSVSNPQIHQPGQQMPPPTFSYGPDEAAEMQQRAHYLAHFDRSRVPVHTGNDPHEHPGAPSLPQPAGGMPPVPGSMMVRRADTAEGLPVGFIRQPPLRPVQQLHLCAHSQEVLQLRQRVNQLHQQVAQLQRELEIRAHDHQSQVSALKLEASNYTKIINLLRIKYCMPRDPQPEEPPQGNNASNSGSRKRPRV